MLKNRPRQNLNPSLEKKLAAYVTAGAATLSALAPKSDAAVVYTSAKEIGEGQKYMEAIAPIDLNHDGNADFNIFGEFGSGGFSSVPIFRTALVYAGAQPGNQIGVVSTFAGIGIAQALNFGQEVGPNLRFSSAIRHTFKLAEFYSIGSGPKSAVGEFYDQKNKFVALKLALNGETYYGWARVSTKEVGDKLAFELVDYAYQSTPNLPILAGQGIPKPEADLLDQGPNPPIPAQPVGANPKSFPATLGLLAYGSDAVPLWRRKPVGADTLPIE